MRQVFITISFFAVLLLLAAFGNPGNNKRYAPSGWPKPVYDFSKNPLSPQTIKLGRDLFYDPLLSADSTISCASCHSPYNAFTHADHALSHGIKDRIGTRNSPALMNLAWQSNFMWDGAVNHLDVQALAPITHPDEMGESLANVIKKLQRSAYYKKEFYKAYKDTAITGEYTLKALSQFMLTLVSSNSKYDSVMRGQTRYNEKEAKGYMLFKANCASCHTEPLFTNGQFENNGLRPDSILKDKGRMRITQSAADSLKFKVPTLRNIEFTYPYMHDGRFKKLSEVLKHYTQGIHQSPTLSAQLVKPIVLSPTERVELTAFLLTLTDIHFLFNPDYTYPKK